MTTAAILCLSLAAIERRIGTGVRVLSRVQCSRLHRLQLLLSFFTSNGCNITACAQRSWLVSVNPSRESADSCSWSPSLYSHTSDGLTNMTQSMVLPSSANCNRLVCGQITDVAAWIQEWKTRKGVNALVQQPSLQVTREISRFIVHLAAETSCERGIRHRFDSAIVIIAHVSSLSVSRIQEGMAAVIMFDKKLPGLLH